LDLTWELSEPYQLHTCCSALAGRQSRDRQLQPWSIFCTCSVLQLPESDCECCVSSRRCAAQRGLISQLLST